VPEEARLGDHHAADAVRLGERKQAVVGGIVVRRVARIGGARQAGDEAVGVAVDAARGLRADRGGGKGEGGQAEAATGEAGHGGSMGEGDGARQGALPPAPPTKGRKASGHLE
jgi:hypothetical protein